jgi:hypothetical protein
MVERLNTQPTRESLPPPNTVRWVASRKASLVRAINNGVLTVEEASVRYSLSLEELLVWKSRLTRHGHRGLRSSRAQTYRAISLDR